MAKLSFTDLVKQVEEIMKDTYTRPDWIQVLGMIDSIIQELRGLGFSKKMFEQFSIDELSRMMGELAVLRTSLIQMRSVAHRNLKVAKVQKETRESDVWDTVKAELEATTGKKPSKTDIEREAAKYMAKSNLMYEMHDAQYERLQSYWYSIPNVLHSLQARINFLAGDYATAKFENLAGEESLLPMGSTTPTSPEAAIASGNTPHLNTRGTEAAAS